MDGWFERWLDEGKSSEDNRKYRRRDIQYSHKTRDEINEAAKEIKVFLV